MTGIDVKKEIREDKVQSSKFKVQSSKASAATKKGKMGISSLSVVRRLWRGRRRCSRFVAKRRQAADGQDFQAPQIFIDPERTTSLSCPKRPKMAHEKLPHLSPEGSLSVAQGRRSLPMCRKRFPICRQRAGKRSPSVAKILPCRRWKVPHSSAKCSFFVATHRRNELTVSGFAEG